jgi:hypothetical protein
MTTEERLRERLATLKAARDQVIADAQKAIHDYSIAIGELEAILTPEKSKEEPAPTQDEEG